MNNQTDPPLRGSPTQIRKVATISPEPMAADRRSVDNRDCPSRTDYLGAALAEVVGGPVGRHALIGRTRLMTPLRVMFAIALVFLALGWSTKAACLQSTGSGPGDQRVANWENQRAYYELCYSDTVPLYGAELLNQGKFPYKSSWVESDASGAPQARYDGQPAVRYMEYPVLTGVYQYVSMALAKTYTAVSKVLALPVIAEVVMFFDVAAFGLALAWLATVWATAGMSGRRIWDAALVAASPLVIFQIFTNFDALATAFAMSGLLAWARRRPVLAGVLIGFGAAAKLYPLLFLGPLLVLGIRTGRLGGVARTAVAAVLTWLLGESAGAAALSAGVVGVFPAQRPSRGRHGLAVQRREIVHRLERFRSQAGFLGAADGAQHGGHGVIRIVLCGNRLHRASPPHSGRGWRSWRSWWWRRSC